MGSPEVSGDVRLEKITTSVAAIAAGGGAAAAAAAASGAAAPSAPVAPESCWMACSCAFTALESALGM